MDSDVDIGTLPISEWQFTVRHICLPYRNNRCRCRMPDFASIKIDVDAHLFSSPNIRTLLHYCLIRTKMAQLSNPNKCFKSSSCWGEFYPDVMKFGILMIYEYYVRVYYWSCENKFDFIRFELIIDEESFFWGKERFTIGLILVFCTGAIKCYIGGHR